MYLNLALVNLRYLVPAELRCAPEIDAIIEPMQFKHCTRCNMAKTDYRGLADAFARDIAAGKLKPGDKLPPQRLFAYKNGIAASTAGRVYAELLRRGLVIGEVGRGTFVAGQWTATKLADRDAHGSRIDLEYNFPILPDQSTMIASSLAGLHRADVLDAALRPIGTIQLAAAKEATASFLAKGAWTPTPDAFVFTGSGKQSIAAAISALAPAGSRIAVEAVTYPMVKSLAARLGVSLVPIPMDASGMHPEVLDQTHRKGALSAIYLQPILQNPLGVSLPQARRKEIIAVAERHGLMIIEDHVYGFLADDEPLAALAPERCIVVDSLSKRVAPGLALGLLCVPARYRDHIAATVRAGAWSVSGFGLDAGMRLMNDGTAKAITVEKRQDAKARQALAAKCLAGFEIQADPRAYHLWLTLPDSWRSEAFAAAAARRDIAVTPSNAFTILPGHAPNAVRLALALPPLDQLRNALTRLAELLRLSTEEAEIVE
jgi:DNA-binding transcriptional MocR family regulator